MALIDKIKAIADAIRNKTGDTAPMTLDEMAESIEYLESDGALATTYILVDEDGYEIPATLVEEEVELTATANDIRLGTTAVTDSGVIEGEKEIPGYITTEGKRVVMNESQLTIPMYSNKCEYNKLLVMICEFNTSISDSVLATMVAIDDHVYEVGSSTPLSKITVNTEQQSIDLGLTNDSGKTLLIRYMSIKENT